MNAMASIESSTSGVHPVVTATDVRSGTWSTNAPPPPGPALKPRTTLRSVLLVVIILALGATGLFERAAIAWSTAKPHLLGGVAAMPLINTATAASATIITPIGDHIDRERTFVEEEPGVWRQSRCVEVDLSDCDGVGADACTRYDC